MHARKWSWFGLVAAGLLVLGCGTDSSGTSGTAGAGGDGGSGGGPPAPPLGCDPLTPSYCGFPYPNDYWTTEDPTTATGMRLALPEVIMPENDDGVRSDPSPFNDADGFSPGIAAMTHMPGATAAGLPASNSIEASLAFDSPTVIIDTETGDRVAHWVDLDEYVVQAKIRVDANADRPDFTINRSLDELRQEQALMLRPAIRLEDSTRYIVAIRGVVDDQSAPIAPTAGFQELRDDTPSDDPVIESRRAHFEDIFSQLEGAGIGRQDLQLAWDFTTASKENNTQWMVHIRDDALAGFPDGVSYRVEPIAEGVEAGIACRLEITFEMPLYMTDGNAGALLNFGADGMPTQNGTFEYTAAMVVPQSAQPPGQAAPLVQFGHGQLGAKEQVLGFQAIAAQLNLVGFALDFKGFAFDDQATIITALGGGDWSDFRPIPERMHQGFVNFLMAMRTLSREANGGPTTELNQALANDCGGAVIDGDKRYYFGGSQGGILGASIMALSTDIERGLLAVPGQSYNLLLNRSVNVDVFAPLMYEQYEWNGLDVQLNLALIQGLWDRAEPTGYSKYIRTDRFPNTPPHEVLIQVSKSDHQVTNLGAHIMARTIGGVVNLAAGDVANVIRPVWGLEVVPGTHAGSGMIEVDFGNPEAPIGNYPPWDDTMGDPHGRAVELVSLGITLSTFYETGVVENLCSGPCDADDL